MQRTWTAWGAEASLAVSNPAVAAAAERIVCSVTDDVVLACRRFRTDSELNLLGPQMADGARLSPTWRTLVETALDAAHLSGAPLTLPWVGDRFLCRIKMMILVSKSPS